MYIEAYISPFLIFRLIKVFDRGSNICSRCDIVLKGLPESKLTPKPRSSGPVSSSHPPPQQTPVKVEDKVTFKHYRFFSLTGSIFVVDMLM